MVEAALHGIITLFSLSNIVFLVIGVISGLLIAVIPGIGSVSMLGIFVPFLLGIEPNMAFAMLIGFIAAGVISDSIPAILLGIPGSASSQATVLDGFPMSKKGEAARAMGASFTSSMLGGIFGAFVLSIAIQVMRPFVLMFGAPEFLLMALWGVTMVAVLSGNAPLKGVIVGGIGLLIGAIGLDPHLGFARWTFKNAYFFEGISLALIGISIFAVPELISLVVRRGQISDEPVIFNSFRGQIQGVKDVFRNKGVLLRASGLGTLIGAIPGLGSSIVDWLAYGMTVQWAKNKEEFGKGDVRGVIAVDGASNAVCGGGLIPTLGFGIPGSTSMAYVLIVLFAHGLHPGASMLTNPDKLSFVYFLIWGLALANIVGASICFLSSGFLVRFTTIPYYYLFAMLIPVIFMAAFYNKNSIYSVVVLLVLSLLGYLFKSLKWPRPPLLVGIVLSRSIESNLGISLSVFGMTWIFRPIALVLWILIFSSLFLAFRFSLSREHKDQVATDTCLIEQNNSVSKNKITLFDRFIKSGAIFTALLLLVLTGGLVQTMNWPEKAARFPLIIGTTLLLVLVIQLIKELQPVKGEKGGLYFDIASDFLEKPGEAFRRALIAIGWIAGLFLGVILIGLTIAIPVFTFLYLRLVGKVRLVTSIGLTISMSLFLKVFGNLAGFYLYKGILIKYFFG